MGIAEVKKTADTKMKKSVEALKTTLSKVRTGRAHTGLLDHVMVDYYGTPTPISQVASVNLLDARTLSVQPWEKNMVGAIEKAIRDSDLGVNPAGVGEIVRVPLPPLNEERRREIVKLVKNETEDAKVAVRNIRREANDAYKKMVKEKECSEDEERRASDDIQKLTDGYIKQIDAVLADKEKEIMTV